MPLARFAKEELGTSAVYLGGLIQLMFGITGRRYVERMRNGKEEGGLASRVFQGGTGGQAGGHDPTVNPSWMPPLDSETPHNFNQQEGGAYW